MIDDNKNNSEDSLAELLRIAGPRPKVSEDVRARVRGAVHDEWQQEVKRRRRVRVVGVAGLAAAAALAGVLLLRPAPTVTPVPQTGTTVETATGSTRSMEWGGGTLRLDSGTRVQLLSDRIASLESGAVYFSNDGPSSGIEVRTPFGAVRDIGTQFEVRLSEDQVRVRVREGRVDLRGTIADAGTELVATMSTIEKHDVRRAGEEWAWVERAAPPIVLEGMTLEDVMRRVAREKGLQLKLRNPAAAAKRLHGSVALSPDEALRAASAAAGVTYTIERGQLVVR